MRQVERRAAWLTQTHWGTGLGVNGFYADLSPDGSRITYSSCELSQAETGCCAYYGPDVAERNYEIAVIGIDGTKQARLTATKGLDHYPAWSPDGSQIMYFYSASIWHASGTVGVGLTKIIEVRRVEILGSLLSGFRK